MVFFMVFFSLSMLGFSLYLFLTLLFSCWILPVRAYRKIKKNGFVGPNPSFPMGNIRDMKNNTRMDYVDDSSVGSSGISHDIHSIVFPYFARWQKSYGKLFIYWLGTEPFLYVAEPEFLRKMSSGVLGKSWGKPKVFKNDREPMFGRGLVMVEGDDWVRHRHVITPAFSPSNLKAMASLMVEPATKMLDRWETLINSGKPEIDVEREITATAGEIIARTSFGLSYQNGSKVFEKLRAMQITLFNSNRYVGVPFSKWMCPKKNLEAKRLGKEIDRLLLSIIDARKNCRDGSSPQKDLLGLLMDGSHVDGRAGKSLTARELVDECKTFFFGGHETTALALTWTLLLLAMYPDWQNQLRDEIRQVIGDGEIDFTKLVDLKKMEWVMKEVLRLYSPAPNAQRQAREDINVDDLVIPNGTNIWIDVVAMHHDPAIWGDDVNLFRPDRFKDDHLYGGCNHKMGFLPFGFGGRMCVGRNLTMMEYKVVLTLMLTRFSFSLSPSYRHSPSILLSLRPRYGLPLLVQLL
ncbi:cytochrome P450, family 715, subfamily A, polypeptide 1 [Hibiscus trionum]|uniref:Cytochrome P450, family 715, subfamily A, polypeptide 1 n=1 Tax=Hibiscus trionum TaxID=183268 RepID=A0A9W7J519_HIBTR|nr:cytochrome P450, family 715, subfamily A, polypeptide 1 [Hibiscus trionum]